MVREGLTPFLGLVLGLAHREEGKGKREKGKGHGYGYDEELKA